MEVEGMKLKVFRLGWVDYEGSEWFYVIKDVSLRKFKEDCADAIVEAFVRLGKQGKLRVIHKYGTRKDGTFGDFPEYEKPVDAVDLWVNNVFPYRFSKDAPNVIDVLKEKGYIVVEEDGNFIVRYGLNILGESERFGGDRDSTTPEMRMVRRRAKVRQSEIKVKRYVETPEEKAFDKKYRKEQLKTLRAEKVKKE